MNGSDCQAKQNSNSLKSLQTGTSSKCFRNTRQLNASERLDLGVLSVNRLMPGRSPVLAALKLSTTDQYIAISYYTLLMAGQL